MKNVHTQRSYPSTVSLYTHSTTVMSIDLLGGFWVNESLPATETAKEVIRIIKEQWIADEQTKKIRELNERMERLQYAGEAMAKWLRSPRNLGADKVLAKQWKQAKETKA